MVSPSIGRQTCKNSKVNKSFGLTCIMTGYSAYTKATLAADPTFKENLVTTVEDLLGMNVVPVFNENDAISKGVMKSTVGFTTQLRHPMLVTFRLTVASATDSLKALVKSIAE